MVQSPTQNPYLQGASFPQYGNQREQVPQSLNTSLLPSQSDLIRQQTHQNKTYSEMNDYEGTSYLNVPSAKNKFHEPTPS